MEGDIQIFCQVYVRDNMIDILRIRRNFLFLQWGFHILLYCVLINSASKTLPYCPRHLVMLQGRIAFQPPILRAKDYGVHNLIQSARDDMRLP